MLPFEDGGAYHGIWINYILQRFFFFSFVYRYL